MKAVDFSIKAEALGDFNIFYTNREGKQSFAVATADLSTRYIQEHPKFKRHVKVPAGSVKLWSWTNDNILIVPYAHVKSISPIQHGSK